MKPSNPSTSTTETPESRPARSDLRARVAARISLGISGLLLAAVLMLVVDSITSEAPSEGNTMEYLDKLRSLEQAGPQLEKGGETEKLAVERFQRLLSDFKAPDFAERVSEVYAEDAFFNDTIKTVHGVEQIREYLVESGEAIDKGEVEFVDLVSDNGNYYFRWVMTIQFKKLADGEDTRSIGMTHIRFNSQGRVVLHQDFWDSSAGLFEHVPVLGWMLRKAKSRL